MSRTPVSRWGVHWAPGALAYLHQARGDTNAVGLREPSPFFVRARRGAICNHLVQLNALNPAREHLTLFRNILRDDSLARFLLPLPKVDAGVAALDRLNMHHLTLLLKMSSPVKRPILSADFCKPEQVLGLLEDTDIQPLALVGVEARHMKWVAPLAEMAATLPRRLLISAKPDVPLRLPMVSSPRMLASDQEDLTTMPWEALGAIVLRAYMRREWDEAKCWFTREPTPANEPKPDRPLPTARNE